MLKSKKQKSIKERKSIVSLVVDISDMILNTDSSFDTFYQKKYCYITQNQVIIILQFQAKNRNKY